MPNTPSLEDRVAKLEKDMATVKTDLKTIINEMCRKDKNFDFKLKIQR